MCNNAPLSRSLHGVTHSRQPPRNPKHAARKRHEGAPALALVLFSEALHAAWPSPAIACGGHPRETEFLCVCCAPRFA